MHKALMALTSTSTANAVCQKDPSIEELWHSSNLNNYLLEYGATATQNMSLCLADLQNVVEGSMGSIQIQILDDSKQWFNVMLSSAIYVPCLSLRLFSITTFASHGHCATVQHNATMLLFEPNLAPVTLMTCIGRAALAADLQLKKEVTEEYHSIPSTWNRDHSNNKKIFSLKLLHNRLGHHKCRIIQEAIKYDLW